MIHVSYYIDQLHTVLDTHISCITENDKKTLVEYLNALEGDGIQIVSVAPFLVDNRWIYYLITWRDAPV
jgi:hypothetical protein